MKQPDPKAELEAELLANTEALRRCTQQLRDYTRQNGEWMNRFLGTPLPTSRPTSRGD